MQINTTKTRLLAAWTNPVTWLTCRTIFFLTVLTNLICKLKHFPIPGRFIPPTHQGPKAFNIDFKGDFFFNYQLSKLATAQGFLVLARRHLTRVTALWLGKLSVPFFVPFSMPKCHPPLNKAAAAYRCQQALWTALHSTVLHLPSATSFPLLLCRVVLSVVRDCPRCPAGDLVLRRASSLSKVFNYPM